MHAYREYHASWSWRNIVDHMHTKGLHCPGGEKKFAFFFIDATRMRNVRNIYWCEWNFLYSSRDTCGCFVIFTYSGDRWVIIMQSQTSTDITCHCNASIIIIYAKPGGIILAFCYQHTANKWRISKGLIVIVSCHNRWPISKPCSFIGMVFPSFALCMQKWEAEVGYRI
jgi:hypothetical protein